MRNASPRSSGELGRWLLRLGTIGVSAAIIYYCLRPVEWKEFHAAAARAELVPAVLGMIIPLFIFWVTDAAFTVRSFQWFHQPVRFRDYFVVKAAAYLLTFVNITFAAGGVFLYFSRKTGVSVARQGGILLWRVTAAVVGAMIFYSILMVVVALMAPGVAAEMGAELWVPFVFFTALVVLEGGAFWFRRGGIILPHFHLQRNSEFWRAFRLAGPREWLEGFAWTVPPLVLEFIGLFFVTRAFQVEVPFLYFLIVLPLALLFAALPIAFGQFGTTTLAWQFFFSGYGSPEEIVALTLFIPTVRLLWRAAVGLVFLPAAWKELASLYPASSQGEEQGPQPGA